MWNWIKKMAGNVWNFIKKHFHKACAVAGAGITMVTLEVIGIFAANYLLLPLAMTSLIGTIALCFIYFMVIFAALTIGMTVFDFLWKACEISKPAETQNAEAAVGI
jgi:hypothetical protein